MAQKSVVNSPTSGNPLSETHAFENLYGAAQALQVLADKFEAEDRDGEAFILRHIAKTVFGGATLFSDMEAGFGRVS